MEQSGPIVVGYDGSDFADEALRKALWLAEKLDESLIVVRAWTISNAPRPRSWAPGYVPPVEDFAEAVLEQLTTQVAARLADHPGVKVEYLTPHGAAGRELVKASRGARLLVVGTRGQGGFAGLLLGSVSDQVVEHAQCDVLVTRRRGGDQAPPRQLKLDTAIEPDEG
ncbi:MAG: universal stress protein [Propionicimonas sp.]|uniref:universal stress protein n=1 Tax=Propionicimonas sp. TaxID=1955623 RepID=UPI002B21D4CD|nr:universal stress protein [Propionicimonas sp.]MEA4945406.1 universal stress protein [Propionicimonas sp.]MEA5052523.1 universal stress protein [Propionicimonas sp.]MEA5119006.1 universal stress protein [Propionicimonas sp.]